MSNGRTVAFIPARGGSKSIPLKNIKEFCGKPLIYWVLKAACECARIDRVFLSTDSPEIRQVAEGFGFPKAVVIERSEESSADTAATEAVMLEFADRFDFEHIVLIQATSPLLTAKDLDGGLDKYFKSGVDSLLSAVRQKRFIWQSAGQYAMPINYVPSERPRRQEWEGFLVENGAFYITSKSKLQETECRISGNIAVYEMEEDSYFEMDERFDWIIAEQLKYRQLLGMESQRVNFTRINLLICDVDGVLTDAGMYYSETGDELKKFNTRDGKGIERIKKEGFKVMFLTSEEVELVRRRAKKLNADFVFTGIKDKKGFLDAFFAENKEYCFDMTAYIGDDVNDSECIAASAFSAVPADACDAVKPKAAYICKLRGGQGCVREVCDLIIGRRKAEND